VAGLPADRSKLVSAADRETVARLGGAPVRMINTRAVLERAAEGLFDPYVIEVFGLSEARPALRRVERDAYRVTPLPSRPAVGVFSGA